MSSGDKFSTTGWTRLTHSAALLGLGLSISFLVLIVVVVQSRNDWADVEHGVPRLRNSAVLYGIALPSITLVSVSVCCHVYQCDAYAEGGPKKVRIPLLLSVVLIPCFIGIFAAMLAAGIDTKYWGIDITVITIYVVVFCVSDIILRVKSMDSESEEAAKGNAAADAEVPQNTNRDASFLLERVLAVISLLGILAIAFAYPFGVIPLFFSGGTETRLAILLVFHVVLTETIETISRTNSSEDVLKLTVDGTITLETAKSQVLQGSLISFWVKQVMAYYRRLMLLNIPNNFARLLAIVVTSVQEALARGFLVKLDTFVHRLRGKPDFEGDHLELQRLVWMCDANMSCIAEFNAIFVSTFAQLLLMRHSSIIAFGYDHDATLDVASVFVQLIVEITLEMLVDNSIMLTEETHGIPVTAYLRSQNGLPVFWFLLCVSGTTFLLSLFSFLRHPHVMTCDSNDACECISLPMFAGWFDEACASADGAPLLSYNTSEVESGGDGDLLADVDMLSVMVALLTGFFTLALIVISVIFQRYRQREHKVNALEVGLYAAQTDLRRKKEMNQKLLKRLSQALEMVDKVMAEGESGADMLAQYHIPYADMEVKEVIGEGSFGTVYKGILRGDTDVAVKTMRIDKISDKVLTKFKSELVIMTPLSHPHLVKLFGGCWTEGADKLCIVLEYCANGSIMNFISSLLDSSLDSSWEHAGGGLALGAARGLAYLHHDLPDAIIHRDVKPENIMVSQDGVAKLADFGESRRYNPSKLRNSSPDLTMTIVGTRLYAAPEISHGSVYDESVDTFSFSIVLLGLAAGNLKYVLREQIKCNQQGQSLTIYGIGWRPAIPPSVETISEGALARLIKRMWDKDPTDRPKMKDVVAELGRIVEGHEVDGSSPNAKKASWRKSLRNWTNTANNGPQSKASSMKLLR